MAKKSKLNLINDDLTWNADRRYKVNSVVQLNGEDYQNITGKNSNPELLIDWQKIYTDIAISDVTGLPTALNDLQLNKEDKANKNIANGYAGLDSSGKIIPTQLPALAITDTFVVASQAEQLALVAEVGDIAVRTDLNKSFILRVTGASTLANWQELLSPTSVDQTIIDGSTNAVSGNAVFDGLATKAPISSVHNPVTLGTANGLSLSTQQLSLGLASSGVTGALSGTDWNTFNGKFNTPTGLTTNYLTKWKGSGFGNSQIFDDGTNTGIGTPTPGAKLDVNGSIYSRSGSILSNSFGGYSGGDVIISTNTSGNASLLFKTATLDRMILNSRGALLINKTDDDLTNQLQVAGTISASPATTANQVVVKSQLDSKASLSGATFTGDVTIPIARLDKLYLKSSPSNPDLSAIIAISKNINAVTSHIIEDSSTITPPSGADGYGLVDMTTTVNGSNPANHVHAYQSRITYTSSANMPANNFSSISSFYSENRISGTGVVDKVIGLKVVDTYMAQANKINKQYGILIENQTVGAINYGIWNDTRGNYMKGLSIGTDTIDLSNALNVNGTISAASYTATSLPVFENNASASSLAVGQFYRTSTGVLMVKF